jgi:hypothetical protein
MPNLFKKIVTLVEKPDIRVLLLILNAFAVGFFFFIAFRYNYMHPDNMGRLMFTTPDTKQYRAVADWLFGKSVQIPFATTLRPFLYPLLLGSIWQISDNPYVFWALQFLLWLAAINLTAIAVYRFTNRQLLLLIAFLVMTINVSTIALTFYALTETLVIFLLTFLLGLLTLTKPIFQLPLIVFVIYVLIKNFPDPKKFSLVTLALLPVALQILINVNLNGLWGVSNITDYTIKAYLLPQVYLARNNIPLDDARGIVNNYDTIQTVKYLMEDPGTSFAAFSQNLGENLTGACELFGYYPKPYIFSRWTSIFFLAVQILFLPAMIYLFFVKKGPLWLPILLMYFFSFIIIFTSGISFNEGDRLVIIALPLWIVIYTCMPAALFDRIKLNRSPAL